jgi:hypothetical protein
MSVRVIRVDQGRSAPDLARGGTCQIMCLLYIPNEIESGSYECTERTPSACRRIRWVYLPIAFIPCECGATPLAFICNERAGSFDDGPSERL